MNETINILVAEDSPTQTLQLRHILEKAGFRVSAAVNGQEALRILEGGLRPTLVISDILMPEMDGYELCKHLRADGRFEHLPVILVTTLSEPQDVIKGLECGADTFIVKPYEEKYLLNRIQYLLSNFELRKNSKTEMGIHVFFAGENYFITAERLQILDLLLSTYENAYHQNVELLEVQNELRKLNERLEVVVQERTAELVATNKILQSELVERKKAEEALSIERNRFVTASRAGKAALWEWDIRSGTLTWSDIVDPMLGYEASEFPRTLQAWEELIHPDDRHRVMQMLESHLERATPYETEYRVSTKKGALVWWRDSGTCLRDEHGKAYQMSGACTDITERKQMELSLHESEALLRDAFVFSPIGMALVAPDGRWLKVNPALCRIVGYSEEELLSKTFQDITHSEDLAADLAYVHRMLAGEIATYRMEKRYLHKQGRTVWINLSASLVRDKEGQPLFFISQIEDIEERKRTTAALRESEERYKRLIESTTSYIFSVKVENGRAISTTHSPGCVVTTGYTPEDFMTDPYLWYRMIHEQDRQLVMERIDALLAGKETQPIEHRIIHKNGGVRWVSDMLVPKYVEGSLVAYDGLVVDITERVHLREAEIARIAAETANKAKSDFLANMSHELRTPLNSIIGFADILDQGLQGELTPDQAQSVRDIRSSGRHLLSLINDILDLSKVEAGKMEVALVEVDIGDLARDMLNFFKEKALKHRLDLTAEISDGTGVIVADARMVKQVIINLLSNAVKFTPDGGSIRVLTRRIAAPKQVADGKGTTGGEFVEVAVGDTGIGIAPDDQEKLFQPFQQVQTMLSREFVGTGLGLSLCKHYVELQGGTIRVESEPGRGSTFTFTLPVSQPAKPDPPTRRCA